MKYNASTHIILYRTHASKSRLRIILHVSKTI